MGTDKALLQVGGRPLFRRVVAALADVTPRVILVGGPVERFGDVGLPVYPDLRPGSALGGLHTGLSLAGTPWIVVLACDMPYPNPRLIRHLTTLREGCDAVVPRRGSFVEPLCAAYSRECLGPIGELLEAGRFRFQELFLRVRTRYVEGEILERLDRDGRSFLNINTPEDLRELPPEEDRR